MATENDLIGLVGPLAGKPAKRRSYDNHSGEDEFPYFIAVMQMDNEEKLEGGWSVGGENSWVLANEDLHFLFGRLAEANKAKSIVKKWIAEQAANGIDYGAECGDFTNSQTFAEFWALKEF